MNCDRLIHEYVNCFNESRFEDAARLFAGESRFVWISFSDPLRGRDGFLEFARRWTDAFSNGRLEIDRIGNRGDGACTVDLVATGTHSGILEMGNYRFMPTHGSVNIRLHHLFEGANDRFTYASVSLESRALIRQLTTLDLPALDAHLDQIGRLRAELAGAAPDESRLRELGERLGRELDAARHILRPYFRR
jgi:hypothetical protein